MIEANNLIIPIAGTLIVGLAGMLAWAGKKFLNNWESGISEIKEMLSGIKEDIEELKLEYHLVKSHINEIESRTEVRFQGQDKQICDNRDRITSLEKRMTDVERNQQFIKIFHKKNHPTDNFEE